MLELQQSGYEQVKQHRWYLAMGFPFARIDGKKILLHECIMGGKKAKHVIDHLNHDPLDARKQNLRYVSPFSNVRRA